MLLRFKWMAAWGTLSTNLAYVKELLAEATGRGATVIAVPEFFTTTIALDQNATVRACALPPENLAVDLLVETATTNNALIGGSYLESRRRTSHPYGLVRCPQLQR